MRRRPIVQADVEDGIMTLSDALEVETERYSTLSEVAAEAEADYKIKVARIVVGLSQSSSKLPVVEKQSRAEVSAADELRAWKLAEAQRQATKESLLSIRARLDALRSLNASVRGQT